MKVLWVVSLISKDVSQVLGCSKTEFGGWVQSMLDKLSLFPEIELTVVGCGSTKKMLNKRIGNIDYYVMPIVGNNKRVDPKQAEHLVEKISPDIIHIQGTEFSISNCFVKFKAYKNVVCIQGILSGYFPYLDGELQLTDYMFSLSFTNLIIGWSLFLQRVVRFSRRVLIENDTIKNAQNFIGRTAWDHAHTHCMNRSAKYFVCNENLRSSFYERHWSFNLCKRHSVFVGNGCNALKGAHFVYEAIAMLVDEFSDIQLFVAGNPPHARANGVKSRIGYGLCTQRILKRLDLGSRVTFTGLLSEDEMADIMLHCNVCVLPSTIENSPNTLGEAMILGVPVIASYTGGVPSMARDEEEVLFYRANDPAMLAWQIRRVFLEGYDAKTRAEKARRRALDTHNVEKNAEVMLGIYKQILDE